MTYQLFDVLVHLIQTKILRFNRMTTIANGETHICTKRLLGCLCVKALLFTAV